MSLAMRFGSPSGLKAIGLPRDKAVRLRKLPAPVRRPYLHGHEKRDVAQSGSAPEWGSGGRRFESGRPDLAVRAFQLSSS